MKINSDWLKWIVLRLIDLDLSYRYLIKRLKHDFTGLFTAVNFDMKAVSKKSARKHVDIP